MSIDRVAGQRAVCTPANSRTGRRLTWWSSSKRSRSSRPRSSTPGGTLGSPTAPSRIASCSRSSPITESGISSPVRCQRAAPRSYVVVSTSDTTSRRTLRPSATTSGPMPSPGITASLMTSEASRLSVAARRPGQVSEVDVARRRCLEIGARASSVRADRGRPIPASTSAGTALSTVTAISASPPRRVRLTWAPAMFTPASPSRAPTTPTTPGPVGVAEEQQVALQPQVDVVAVDLGELLHLLRAGQRAGHAHRPAAGQHAADGDQVAVVLGCPRTSPGRRRRRGPWPAAAR